LQGYYEPYYLIQLKNQINKVGCAAEKYFSTNVEERIKFALTIGKLMFLNSGYWPLIWREALRLQPLPTSFHGPVIYVQAKAWNHKFGKAC
jgi:hypothetical protein